MEIIAGVLDDLVTFLVGLLVGGLGIYVGAALVTGEGDFRKAVWTALIAALAATAVSIFVGWVPLVGAVASLVVYLGVIKLAYGGSWVEAGLVALVAWVAVTVVRSVLGGLAPF